MKKGKNVFKKYVQSIFNNSWKTNYVYMLDIYNIYFFIKS